MIIFGKLNMLHTRAILISKYKGAHTTEIIPVPTKSADFRSDKQL